MKLSRLQDSAFGPKRIRARDLFASLPPEWPADLMPAIQRLVVASGVKVVVLDDDPTGTQTVHNVPVLTEWSVESLQREFVSEGSCLFVLTNSRSLSPDAARELNRKIGGALKSATAAARRRVAIVSRSDSTLRGHFPVETDALSEVLGPFDGVLFVTFLQTSLRHTTKQLATL